MLVLVIIALYMTITVRSLYRLTRERDVFTRLAGTGLACMFGVQAMINMGVAVRLLPPGSADEEGAIVSPTTKGVILIRRLAPDAERFAAAVEAGKGDACRIAWRSRVGAS